MTMTITAILEYFDVISDLSLSIKLLTCLGLVFALYYKVQVAKVPQLICRKGTLLKFITKHVPVTQETFSPFFLIYGSALQTIAGALLRSEPRVLWDEVEDLDLPDNGQVHLHWAHGSEKSSYVHSRRPTVLFLPGLTGNHEANYICHFSKHLDDLGFRAIVFTYRGMGGKGLKTAKTYCACYTDDLVHVVNHIKKKYPEAPLMAVGVSLGGMILFHYLARTGKDSGLVAAMTVSIAWNPFESMKTLSTPLNRLLYNERFARRLVAMVEKHSHLFERMVNWDHVRQSSTIHEFDESFTAKVFGFESLDHYYASATAGDKVDKIMTPLLALNSKDDPFSPGYCIPVEDIGKSEHLALLLTDRGGHVGFMDTFFGRDGIYMDRLFTQYVCAVFNNLEIISNI